MEDLEEYREYVIGLIEWYGEYKNSDQSSIVKWAKEAKDHKTLEAIEQMIESLLDY